MKPKQVIASVCFALLMCVAASAQDIAPTVQLSISDDDGLVALNEQVTVTASIRNRVKKPISGTLHWSAHTVAFDPPDETQTEFAIDGGETQTLTYDISIPAAGFADVQCKLVSDDFSKQPTNRSRIGSQPLQIEVPLTKESDFDAFWQQSLRELRGVAMKSKMVEQPGRESEKRKLYEVTLRSFGDIHVRGWLEVPKTKGPHPVVIRVPGYGANMKPIDMWDDMIVFSFNPRGHGNSQDEIKHDPVDYWIRGLDNKDGYYYRGAYLDCVRAVDFVSSLDGVDTDRIAVWGGSQGGGFAFATAALDQRVDYCVADIPFLCDWVNYFKLTHWPEMDKWIADRPEQNWTTTLQTLSYFDTMNLADRIKCPTVMGIGLQDQVCPPTTDFAVYNRIKAKKQFKIYPDKGHGLGGPHYKWVWQQMREAFGLR